jgi:hypothetical protein
MAFMSKSLCLSSRRHSSMQMATNLAYTEIREGASLHLSERHILRTAKL